MMAGLLDGYTMSNDPVFVNRVSQAVAETAYTVRFVEADTVPLYAERLELARAVAEDVNAFGYKFARMVSANPTISANAPNQEQVPDSDIQYVVAELWNTFTKASP